MSRGLAIFVIGGYAIAMLMLLVFIYRSDPSSSPYTVTHSLGGSREIYLVVLLVQQLNGSFDMPRVHRIRWRTLTLYNWERLS